MTKRILAMVLVLAMVLSLVPTVVLAEGTEVVRSPKAGTHTDAGHSDDCGLTSGWKPWPGTEGTANTLPTSGQYYLESNITLSAQVELTGNLTLCLNGYVIKQTAATRIVGTAKNNIESILTITDCTAYEDDGVYYAGALTGGSFTGADGGGAIFVRPNGTLKVYDGRITENHYKYSSTTADSTTGGGAVMVRAATGGYHGEVYIYGGEFSNNTSRQTYGNKAARGGAISFGTGSVFEITGGVFKNNIGLNGGAIFAGSGTGSISNATFTCNEATSSGSAIHVNAGLQLTIGDGTVITGNTGTNTNAAEGYSAAVVMGSSSCKLTLTGKVYIADNTTGATGVASLAFNKEATDTLYVNELAAGSYVEFSTPKTVPAAAGDVIALDGNQSSWNNGWVAHMGTDGKLQHISYTNGEFGFATGHFHENVEYQPLKNADQLIGGGAYYLEDEIVALAKAARLTDGVTTSICLNGNTLKSTATSAAPIATNGGNEKTVINVDDCTAYTDGDGVYHAGAIDGMQNKSTGHGGGAFMIRPNGTLNFYNGKITGCTAVTGGGAIFNNGTVNIYGGQFSGNSAVSGTAAKDGGAIYNNTNGILYAENAIFSGNHADYSRGGAYYGGGTATIKNCSFTGNSAKTGGAVCISGSKTVLIEGCTMTGNSASVVGAIAVDSSSATVTIKDTTITGNTTTGGYGAVNVIGNAKPVKLVGKVIISGNTKGTDEQNLHVQVYASDPDASTDGYDVTGLTAGSSIGVSLLSDRVTAGLMHFTTVSASNNRTYFTSDDSTYEVVLNDDNKLELVKTTTPTPPPADAHAHTLCNDTGCTEHTDTVVYEPWGDDDSEKGKLPTSGNWYLVDHITVSEEVNLSTAITLNLCLNGKTVTGGKGSNLRAYSTTNNVASTIQISDCQGGAKFTGFENTSTGSGGGVIFVRPGSTLKVFDVTFENNVSYCIGGAITTTGTTYLYDCVFTGNQAYKIVKNNDGVATTTWTNGGAIYVNVSGSTYGELYVYGATFQGNKGLDGGTIYAAGNTTTYVEDAVFEDNTATDEGGVYCCANGDGTFKNVKITDNKAKTGSALCVYGGAITMENVEITGGHSDGYGAFHMNRNHSGADPITVTMKGKVIIDGNTAGASQAAQNLYMRQYESFVDATGLTEGSKIGVTMEADRISAGLMNITTGQNGTDISSYFTSDDDAWKVAMDQEVYLKTTFEHEHCECGLTTCTDPTHKWISYNAWTKTDSLPPSGNYCLVNDVTVSKEVELSADLNLCLHGRTINGYTGKSARAYSTKKGVQVTVNVTDCEAKTVDGVYTAGKITGFTNTHTDSGAGGIFIREGGTLNFYEGIIENCTSATGGAAIYVHTGTANIYGGLITGNKAYNDADSKWVNGGGIFLYKATLNVYGGEISNNEASYGGGIHVYDGSCVLNIHGGKITGNIAQANGGGVQAAYAKLTFNISGDPIIIGNKLASGKANNVRLGGTGMINVADLGEKASIGITANSFRAISTKTKDYTKNFVSDDTKLSVIYQNEVLYMGASGNHKHCLCTGATAIGCDHEQMLFAEWDDPTTLPPSGNYYLSVDVEIATQERLEGAELNLCLNGHTVKVAENGGRAYYMTSGATLNISDCEGTGKFTNAKQAAILSNANGTDMEVNLYNGIFTENHSKGSGGAIIIQGECTFNMYGGKVVGNSATSSLKLDDKDQPILDKNGNQTYSAANAGGVYIGAGAAFNMYGGEISGNEAKAVGYLKAGATTVTNAGGIGGGIQITGGSVANLYGGKVSGNTGYTGGGIFVTGTDSVLNLLGTEVSGNTALHGGGIISQTNSVVNMKAGKVTGNISTGSGAGMYVSTGTTLNMTGGEFYANEAKSNGGGLYALSSAVNLSGGRISGNKANNGAGIYAAATTSGGQARAATINLMEGALITDNHATTNGGGIMMSGHSTMTAGEGSKIIMTGGEISKNTGKNAGGILTQTKSAFEMSGGKITGNKALNGGGGGGVYISTGTKFTMTGGQVHNNIAEKNDGGGIYLLRSTAELKGGSVNYNTAANGGGVKIGGANVNINGVSIVGNKAVGKTTVNATTGAVTTSAGTGGGVHIGRAAYKKDGVQMYDTPVINIYNMYVANNTSTGAAGGILVQSEGTKFNMYGGTITGNEAPESSGGGIYFSTKTSATVTGGKIFNNKAKNAAAMYFLNCVSNVSGLKVYGNEATNAGGAFTVSGKTTVVNMKNVEVYDNTAAGAAGATVVQSYATLNLEDSKFYGNEAGSTAGAVYFSNPGYGNFKNVEIYENVTQKGGGGVYVGSNSIATMDNVTIRDNTAGADYGGGLYNRGRLVITNSKILNNTIKGGSGGGIGSYKVSSTLLADSAGVFATNCIISGNKADLQGGGVQAHRGCPTYLTDCIVTDNTAGAEGGGIFADGRMGLQNVTVTGNTSGGEGFAVYLTPSEFDGHSYQTGYKRIGGDMIIKDNNGGDMYLGEGTALAVIGETLGEKSHVNITLHSGVLSQWVHGVYNYEGGNCVYTLTAGNRSITDPEPIPVAEDQTEKNDNAPTGDVLLYVGLGVFVIVIAAVAVVLATKKKKAGKTATEATKE